MEETGDAGGLAVGGEDDGVDVGVVEAAVDNIDAFEAGDGFKVDLVIEDEEVVAACEGEAHFTGEEAVFGEERVVGAGGEDDDGRGEFAGGGEGAEGLEELEGEVDDAVVIGEGAVEVVGLLGHKAAVLDGEAESDGGVGEGAGEAPAARGVDEVEAEEGGGGGAVGFEAEARAAVVGIGENDLGGEDFLVKDLLAGVDVGEEGVDEPGALMEGGVEEGPVGGG